MSEWQTIETAPEATLVLFFSDGVEIPNSDEKTWIIESGWRQGGVFKAMGRNGVVWVKPSFWKECDFPPLKELEAEIGLLKKPARLTLRQRIKGRLA